MKRILSLLLVLLVCFSFLGAVRMPQQEEIASAVQSSLKKNGMDVTSTASLSMYDVVTVGRYPQGIYGQSEDIEWIVIGFDGNERVKLLSRYALDVQQYNDNAKLISWTSSTLYQWLNAVFKMNAFNAEERSLLATDVTLLSMEDAQTLSAGFLRCDPTAYAVSLGANPTRCMWWLSNHAIRREITDYYGDTEYYSYATVVNENGVIAHGMLQSNFKKSVRPVIYLDLNSDAPAARESALVLRRGMPMASVYDLNLFDTVTFGRYGQAVYADPTPIEWIVIGFDGNQVKLLAKYGLDGKRYNDIHAAVTWKTSTLYSWLNNSFKYSAFTADEQALLADGVTLLTAFEAEGLPAAYRTCEPTAVAIANGVNYKRSIWWLSEPTQAVQYKNSNNRGWCASAVSDSGEVQKMAYQISYDGKVVRPVIVLDFSKLG